MHLSWPVRASVFLPSAYDGIIRMTREGFWTHRKPFSVSLFRSWQTDPQGRNMNSLLVLASMVILFAAGMANGQEKITIGIVEDVILLPWGIKMPARIDTGAARSSLDARDFVVRDDMVEFKLPKEYGNQEIRLPLIGWVYTRSAEAREKRPVVALTLCIGPKKIRAEVNLNDRSRVRYPLILGRDVLRENFVVDCLKSRYLSPNCPEGSTR